MFISNLFRFLLGKFIILQYNDVWRTIFQDLIILRNFFFITIIFGMRFESLVYCLVKFSIYIYVCSQSLFWIKFLFSTRILWNFVFYLSLSCFLLQYLESYFRLLLQVYFDNYERIYSDNYENIYKNKIKNVEVLVWQ